MSTGGHRDDRRTEGGHRPRSRARSSPCSVRFVVSYFADLSDHGVSVLGTVPGGLPSLGLPDGMSWSDVGELFPTAVSIFVLILAQSAATSRAYAAKYNEPLQREHRSRGSRARQRCSGDLGHVRGERQPHQDPDGRRRRRPSQLAQITTGAITVIVLLFLTKPLEYLPERRARRRRVPDRHRARRHRGHAAHRPRLRRDEFVVAADHRGHGRPDRCRAGHRAGDRRCR